MLSFQKFLRPVYFSVLPLFLGMSAAAQSKPATASDAGQLRGAPFSASEAELRAASALVPVDRDYDDQILLEETTYKFGDDGTLSYQHRLIFRVDGKDGVDGWSELSARWDPWYEKPAQLHARVLQADGKFAELDQKTITDGPIKGEDELTYSSEHERRAPLPGVAVGSIVEQVRLIEEKTPYFVAGGLYRFYFQTDVPMARARLIVDLPTSVTYREKMENLPKVVVTRDPVDATGVGRRHLMYEQVGIDGRHSGDIDLSTNEPDTPLLEFSTGTTWKALATAYAVISDPQTVTSDAEAILPKDLPQARQERILEIVARLHKEVRYTGVEFGAAKLTPQRPSEVIARHYGDCKDKATLLVAMLRAAKIPAYLALLSTGPGRDVQDSLPGMTQFDHAIVYVPAAQDGAAVWIDATAEFNAPGSLPFADEGRMALVIAPDTSGLTKTPEPKPNDSRLVETRIFKLATHGPSHVTERSETYGIIDANYRSLYGNKDTKKIRTDLEGYAHSAYLAKSLVSVTHGPAEDMSKPFELSLEIDGAVRGTTALDEAEVVIFPTMVTGALPKWFVTTPEIAGPDTSAEKKHVMELAAANRKATYTFRPYLDERRVRIVIPDGFALRTLPPNKTTKLGRGTLTEEYSAVEPGVVLATYKFDTGDGQLTAEQAIAMRDAILELNKRDYVGVFFDQVGAKALAEGHIRAALDADRALIAQHPKEALPHVQLSRALLQAGIGDGAHEEAKRATELDPTSSVAYSNLGWTLEHNSLGVRFGSGYDLAGAIAAYKKAIALEPTENTYRFDLAILYEFDVRGIRYAEDADLAKAAAQYGELIERAKDSDPNAATQYRENLLYLLLFQHKYAELDQMLAKLSFSNGHAALAIASAAAQHDVAAGVAQANQGNVSGPDRNKNLLTAGKLLAQLRMYMKASAILQAGIGGGDDAPSTARLIELYKNLKAASLEPLPAGDPARPVQLLTFATMAGTLTVKQANEAMAHTAYSSEASRERDVQKGLEASGMLKAIASKSDMTEVVLFDLIAGSMTFTSTGDDESGHIVLATAPGSETSHFFVEQEAGAYRLVSDDHDNVPIGNAVLHALEHKQMKLAKSMLDWKRDLTHKAGGDDAFEGPLLPRFWTVGSAKEGADSPEAMRLAGISLLAGSMDAKPYLAEIASARETAHGQRQIDLDLLLASAADGAEEAKVALAAAKRLLQEEPDSLTALTLAGTSYEQMNDPEGWLALLKPLIAKKPTDHDLLLQEGRAYEAAHDFAKARVAYQAVMDSGKAKASDYNGYAWLGLFDGHTGEAELKAAQQSNMLSKNGSFGDLHTLACVYAAMGKTTEARQVLAQAMSAANVAAPNSEVWYALGQIYEQYGAKEAALAAYSKVQAHPFDDHTYVYPMSTYVLAEARIKALRETH